MIRIENMTKRYDGGLDALSLINFSLQPGEMAFVTGHSGAGKTTLLRLLAKLEDPSSGSIIVNGQDLKYLSKDAAARYRSKLGITLQMPHLLNDRSVFENVALPLYIQGLSLSTITKRVHAALDMVSLLHKERRLPLSLSAGEQQRVGIARAVVHKPMLLLADEPTGNLDPGLSNEIMKLYEQFNQVGVSVLIATHDLALIARSQHRIVMLKEGRLC